MFDWLAVKDFNSSYHDGYICIYIYVVGLSYHNGCIYIYILDNRVSPVQLLKLSSLATNQCLGAHGDLGFGD